MNTLTRKIVLCIGLMMLFGQQTVFADYKPNSHQNARMNHWKAASAPYNYQFGDHFDRRRETPLSSYPPYYKSGHRVNPLPYGHNRNFVNNTRHSRSYGYFYRPSRTGRVTVEAPIGALPRLHRSAQRRGQPYYSAGYTSYRRHP